MRTFRHHRPSAWIALAFLILSSALPAFGALGHWICPDGRVCVGMAANPVRPNVHRAVSSPCCSGHTAGRFALKNRASCRYELARESLLVSRLSEASSARFAAPSPDRIPASPVVSPPPPSASLPSSIAHDGIPPAPFLSTAPSRAPPVSA